MGVLSWLVFVCNREGPGTGKCDQWQACFGLVLGFRRGMMEGGDNNAEEKGLRDCNQSVTVLTEIKPRRPKPSQHGPCKCLMIPKCLTMMENRPQKVQIEDPRVGGSIWR